jgi:hypothetical protein
MPTDAADACSRCTHAMAPHVLVATVHARDVAGKSFPAGGHMYCPVDGCQCHGTWSMPDDVAGFDVKMEIARLGPPDAGTLRRVRGH